MAKRTRDGSHKKQHFVPQCYTKPWLDPASVGKPMLDPYVWVFNKDGTNPRRKSPANLFTESDIYTIPGVDGARDLRLEHGFQQLEDQFTRIRNLTLAHRRWPNPEQMAYLLAFVATAQARTRANRDHHRQQWGRIRERMEDFQRGFDAASPEKKRAYAAMGSLQSSADGPGMNIEEVKLLEEQPIQKMIAPVVATVMRCFAQMHVAVLCTADPLGFITSDHPCTWFDPESYKLPPLYRGAGLGSRTIEVTLPVSPSQCIFISHNDSFNGFIDIEQRVVDELNYRHAAHADQSLVGAHNEIRPYWVVPREAPEDAWEKIRARKVAAGEIKDQ